MNAKNEAKKQFKIIKELTLELRFAKNCISIIKINDTIKNNILSLLVRSSWRTPEKKPDINIQEYQIMLFSWERGVRVTGNLDAFGIPVRAVLQYRSSLNEPWRVFYQNTEDQDILLDYTRVFWYGD